MTAVFVWSLGVSRAFGGLLKSDIFRFHALNPWSVGSESGPERHELHGESRDQLGECTMWQRGRQSKKCACTLKCVEKPVPQAVWCRSRWKSAAVPMQSVGATARLSERGGWKQRDPSR